MCTAEIFICVFIKLLMRSSTLCLCDEVISGHIKRSSNLDGKGRCWSEDRTNICFRMKIFTSDECAGAVLASVV